ncbi:HAD-IA family hydrolase [bacterium]|nr:HAD-IA family hydrolase [bacterium]
MIKAVIFDKDGTLFDFRMSWGGWTRSLLAELAPRTEGDLAATLGFEPEAMAFAPDSAVIAHTTDEIAMLMLPHLPGMSFNALMDIMNRIAAEAPMAPAVPLREVLSGLTGRGLVLGLATNDTEAPARAHLTGAGVIDLFAFVAGCDSGYGGKPAPGQLLAFAAQTGLPAGQIAMVGDSLHDLDAARRAGMKAVGVLTGPARRETLTPHAHVVLASIAELGDWIDGFSAS